MQAVRNTRERVLGKSRGNVLPWLGEREKKIKTVHFLFVIMRKYLYFVSQYPPKTNSGLKGL